MTEETQRLIQSLSKKTRFIQHSLQQLKQENADLQQRLTLERLELDECRVAKSELEQRYTALKIAKSLSNGENDDLKKRIDAMVREIDACIELVEQ